MLRSMRDKLITVYKKKSIEKHGCWFIDIPRTSTSSIRRELASHFGVVYSKVQRRGMSDHVPAKQMKEFLGADVWDGLFTFSLVRNPWSRQYSYYHWAVNNGFWKGTSFRKFILEIDKQFETGKSIFAWHGPYYGSIDYLIDENGTLIVDFVGKYENREHDLKVIAEKIGCKNLGNVRINAQAPEDKHYSQFYDDETAGIIKKVYHRDIELFGYKFESD